MVSSEREKFAGEAGIIKALAHPTRILLLHQLAQGRRAVHELTQAARVDISTVSKHLSILKKKGIVGSERQGLNIYYHLKLPCIMNFFKCAEQALRQAEEAGAEKAHKAL